MVTIKLITANTTAINFQATIFIPLLRYYSYHYYCIAVLPIPTVSSATAQHDAPCPPTTTLQFLSLPKLHH